MRNAQRSVTHFTGLLAEDGVQQAFFGSQLSHTLRRNFTDQNVAGVDFRTDADDAALVEIAQSLFAHVRNITRNFFRSQLRIAGFGFVFLDVDRSVYIFLNQLLAQQDRILVVVTFPSHERNNYVAAQGQFAHFGRRTIRKNVALLHNVASFGKWTLIYAGPLVRTHKFV
ncbi:hypothetical protein D3C73_403740 [compost metagenome]